MELHPKDRIFPVPERHDLPGNVHCGHLQAIRHTPLFDYPGVVTARVEDFRQSVEQYIVLGDLPDRGGHAVKDLCEVLQAPSESLSNSLMPKADPQDCFLGGIATDQLRHDPRFGRQAGARRQDDQVVRGHFFQADGIVPSDYHLFAQDFRDVLDEVVGERVVVV